MLKDLTIEKYLEELSSESPTPGGGSVAGISGALSASLISMVCNLTIGKRAYRQSEDEMKKILENARKLREEFTILAQKDTEVFDEVMKAYKWPADSDEEKAERTRAIEETTKRAALVPMDMLRRCESIANLSLSVATRGNENSISDAGVAALMSLTASKAASLNILINLSTISDDDFVAKLKSEQNRVLKEIKSLVEETMQVVDGKL